MGRNCFRQGLVDAAMDANAVILTGGTHSGVMKHTGKAMQEYSSVTIGMNIPCIGFTSYPSVNYSDELRSHLKKESKLKRKKIQQHRKNYQYSLNSSQRKK